MEKVKNAERKQFEAMLLLMESGSEIADSLKHEFEMIEITSYEEYSEIYVGNGIGKIWMVPAEKIKRMLINPSEMLGAEEFEMTEKFNGEVYLEDYNVLSVLESDEKYWDDIDEYDDYGRHFATHTRQKDGSYKLTKHFEGLYSPDHSGHNKVPIEYARTEEELITMENDFEYLSHSEFIPCSEYGCCGNDEWEW